MLVRLLTNYGNPRVLRQTPASAGIWDGVRFTFDDVSECDYLVVLNHPDRDVDVRCRDGGRWLLVQEPHYRRNRYFESYFPFFDRIYSQFLSAGDARRRYSHTASPWLLDRDFDALCSLPAPSPAETHDEITWITSAKNFHPGHRARLAFLAALRERAFPFQLYGKGFRPVAGKLDVLHSARYTLAVENWIDDAYWTEKVGDAFLSWTLPFYAGCPRLADYFPEQSFVPIELSDVDGAIETMQRAVREDWWAQRLPAIRVARERYLHEHQLFPFLVDRIREHADAEPEAGRIRARIPKDPRSRLRRAASRIRKRFIDDPRD